MITTRQAAQLLGVSERQVQRYIHAGLLKAQQLGDHATAPWVIAADSLEHLRAMRATQQEKKPSPPGRRSSTPNE